MRRNIDRINAIRPRLLASLCSTTLLAHGSMTGRVQFSWLFFEKLARISSFMGLDRFRSPSENQDVTYLHQFELLLYSSLKTIELGNP